MKKKPDQIHFRNRDEFRSWLQSNHDKNPGIWMVYFKKHTGQDCIKYEEALEEALCFGWIDSLIKRIDDERYARKFTPRTNIKKWSEVNKKKVIELIHNGRMTHAGLIKTDGYSEHNISSSKAERSVGKSKIESEIPDFIIEELARNEPALENFKNLAPTYKRHYILWITNAKKDETLRKRLKESIGLLKENKKLGLK